jgi:Protein of unknown function (DUF2867)
MTSRLANSAHTSRPWRIHEIAPDFRLEDVWELPVRGGADDFPRLVEVIASLDPWQGSSRAARALFSIRARLGEVLGWDASDTEPSPGLPTLVDRLPDELREGPAGPDFESLPAVPLYLMDDEYAAEVANRTVHGIVHLGWVPDESCGYRAQMAVLVKPNGALGDAYMVAIRPFRHLIVYPPLLRDIGDAWAKVASSGEPTPARA